MEETSGDGMTGREIRKALETHHPSCYGWALHCCHGDRSQAQEVLHNAYLAILEGRARFAGKALFKTWLFGVIRVTAMSWRMRWRRSFGQPLPDPQDQSPSSGPEERLYQAQLRQMLEKMLSRLPQRQRDLLHLVFYQELTVEEASRVLGISTGSARTHYHRGKKRLRRDLQEAGVENGQIWRPTHSSRHFPYQPLRDLLRVSEW